MSDSHTLSSLPRPNHHPSDALLVGYGAGCLCEGLSLAVALHLLHCLDCRAALAAVDAVGGALLEECPPDPLERLTLADTLARLDGAPAVAEAPPRRRREPEGQAGEAGVPGPLKPYIASLEGAPWRRLAPGVERVRLLRGARGGATHLLRVTPGTAVPHHGHAGLELTVVLSGSFTDERGRYAAGDMAEADGDTRHRPVADPGAPCLCLLATNAPLRFTGLLGRLMRPFLGL
ncbi:putative transcriptional regulator [Azospirillum agricola]|uniref:ChrR family anti-sigma-E factor n=1 Tax=Azospirillum agricola TaxID=1720247 RepID=UPI001AE6B44F|nr:ChrR family anti-sigma-E factor [Azospirillum agricola]MBP2228783.1 putative transcriptional regulator [Azospirillum agricola]